MVAQRSSVVTFRLNNELRSSLSEMATRQGVTVSDLLQGAVEQLVRPAEPDAFEQTASIPARMLAVERWHGLSVIESSRTLVPFGVRSALDLATPDRLLEGLGDEPLKAFMRTYEVEPDWLKTGQGPPHCRTHMEWSALNIARRITELWVANRLRRVRLISNRAEPSLGERTPVIVTLEKAHPHPELRHHYRVFESWPTLGWEGGNASLLEVLRFCLSLFNKSRAMEVYPSGATLGAETFSALNHGTLHLAQALTMTEPPWNPERAYRELKNRRFLSAGARYELELAEAWPLHDELVESAYNDKYHAFNVTSDLDELLG